MKTLFVVDKESLYKQWIREIVNFTNINPEQIGTIQQKLFKIDNKPFSIAMVQTLLSQVKKDPKTLYEKLKNSGFGLVFFDEVHNTNASEQYSKSSIVLSAPNIIGLSATPFKYGGQDILMRNVVGDLLYNEKSYQLLPKISFHYYKSGLEKIRFIMSKMNFTSSKAFYNKKIIESQTYLQKILNITKQALLNKHKIIIICWTEKQVQAISTVLSSSQITNRQFYGKSRDFEKTDDVLVATYQYAGTGFDFKELSCLIYACPLSGKVSLIQTAGRVLRECQNKTQPEIHMLVDISIPTQSIVEANRSKKIFKDEFQNVEIIDIEDN